MVTIYTDGASRGNPGPGGWGAIVLSDNRAIELGGREEHTTNNRMELMGAIKSLKYVAEKFPDSSIELNTDSEYVMKGITLWIRNWQAKGWKTAGRKKVLNQDLWRELLAAAEGKKIEWKYVAGHSDHKLNDRCDEIATAFADGIGPRLYNGARDGYKPVS